MKGSNTLRSASLALALVGCASEPPPPTPPPARSGSIGSPSSPPTTSESPPEFFKGIPLAHWEDPSTGPAATLVYVGEARAPRAVGAPRLKPGEEAPLKPSVIISSSDPANQHFNRKNTAVLTVQRTTKEELGQLLRELRQDGLDQLAWEDQPYDADIGPERGLYFYKDGKRQGVRKNSLPEQQKAVFSAIEKRLIAHSQRFVEASQRPR